MSVLFESGNQEIWFPSLRVARLYVDEIKSLEMALELKSGISSIESDTVTIDSEEIKSFLNKALERIESTNNRHLFLLARGCIVITIAINAKISGQWPQAKQKIESLILEAKSLPL
ncbi:MAG: DUF6086 family protein [Cyanophyceae cyanobacterium]